jgi:AraC-like DNA-binding protein
VGSFEDSTSENQLLLIDPNYKTYWHRLRSHLSEWKIILEPDPQKATDFFFHTNVDIVLLGHAKNFSCLRWLDFFKYVKPSIPVIVLTDAGSEELALTVFRKHAWDYFKKPFKIEELKMSLESALSSKKKNGSSIKGKGISRAIKYINENFDNQLRLCQIAQESAMSLSCFERTFKKEMGTTYTKFLNKFRISRAAKMLEQEDLSISEIAFACGFTNPYHFTRMFNRIMAMPPRTYRKSIRKAFSIPFPPIKQNTSKN